MKTTLKYGSILIGSIALALASAENQPDQQSVAAPSAGTTFVDHKEKSWSIEELNQIALHQLRAAGTMPKDASPQCIFHVTPDDPTNMCQILYVQKFFQPCWRVTIGYDGKVIRWERKIKKEG